MLFNPSTTPTDIERLCYIALKQAKDEDVKLMLLLILDYVCLSKVDKDLGSNDPEINIRKRIRQKSEFSLHVDKKMEVIKNWLI